MASGLRWLTRRTARTRGEHFEDRALTAQSVPPVMLAPTAAGERVTPTSALRIADAYACIRALSDAAASLPLIAYRATTGGRARVQGGPADLLRRPAPATTQAELIGQLVAHLQLHGNAYLGKFRAPGGQLDQLALLHPERVIPEIRAGRPRYTVTGPKGERSIHGPEDIIHVRSALSVDGLTGLSPVGQARQALGLSSALTEHAARFFAHDARPGGILKVAPSTVAGDGGDVLVGDLHDRWTHGHEGVANAHRIAVIAGEVDFLPIGMPMDDAQFLEQRRLSATEVARVFRVPPWIVGAQDGASMTYSNVEQESLHFTTYSLRPWLVLIEQALSADEDLCPGPIYVEFLLDALLRADSSTRAEVYTRALHPLTGWMTRAEVRRLENLEPEDAPAGVAAARQPDRAPSVNGAGA